MPQVGAAAAGLDPQFDFAAGRPLLADWYKRTVRKKTAHDPLIRQE
ncbi:MAG: hypothetical protein U1F11_12970 [Steroidobacteraceae bacterium]